MYTEIKKGKGIDGLVSEHGLVDETRQISAEPTFQGLEKMYKKILDDGSRWNSRGSDVTQVLTPEQIDAFLQTTIRHEERQQYARITGLFITKLIQNSYDYGHNNFTLDTTTLKELPYIGFKIKGTREPIEITIIGNTGNHCGYGSENATYNMTGNTGDACGGYSENSVFNITGNTGSHCGHYSKNSTYNITGNAGPNCGYDSKKSTYKTPNKETLNKMLEDVTGWNRVVFIKDGSEEVVRDYNDNR